MAVEIPVVVDINASFKEAAAQVPSAIRPLQQSVDKYTKDLMSWTEKMRNAKIDSPEFIKAAKNIQAISQALEVAEDRLLKFSSNPGSIRRMSGELEALERRWQKMGSKQKFDASGNLSADAQKLYESYKKMAAAIAESGKTLSQMYSDEQKIAEEQRKVAATAQAHQDALRATASSIKELSASSAAWRQELNNINIYKNPELFQQAARNAEYLSRQMAAVSAQVKILGANTGSIDQLNARLQEIVRQYNALSDSDRRGVIGKQLVNDAKALSAELKKEEASVQRIIQEEQRLDNLKKQSLQTRRKENAILKMNGDSIRILQAQESILSQRLSKAKFGSAEFEQLQTRLDGVRKKLKEVQGGVDNVSVSMQKQSVILRGLTSMASMYFSVFGALRFVKQIRDVTGELEFQRISLGRLIQDVERGNYLFERIKEQAIESPFRIKDLVTYTKQLAAYRVEQEELFHTTNRLADISAGLGVDMNRLILAYGQVRAASVLRGQELRQFTEAGIPLVQLLAEKFTDLNGEMMTTGEVFKKISDRAVPFSMIADIFEDLTEKGGMFYQMQEEQAKTLKGRWEKLKDAYDVALQSIGDTETFQRQNDIVFGSLRFIADNLRVMTKLVDAAILSWASYNAVLWIAGVRTKAVATAEQEALIAESLRTKKVSGLFVKIKAQAWAEAQLAAATRTATIGTNALSRALAKLKIALLTNPYAFAAAAIIGIVLALTRYKKAVDDSAEATHTLNRAVDDMRAFNKRHDRVQKLIDQYKTLTTLEERNAAQNETLARTTKKLANEFPQLSENLNNNNLSLQERLKIVKELNKEEAKRLEDEITDKTRTLEVNRTKLTYAKEDYVTAENAKKEAEAYYLALQEQLDKLGKKEGRGAFMKLIFGGNEYDEIYRQLAMQRKVLDEAEEKANKVGDSVRSLEEAIDSLEQEIGNSNKTTQEADETWEEWKKQIHELQKGMLKVGDSPLFDKDDISGFESVYDLSKKLKKEMDDLTVSIAAMKTMFESMEEGDAKDSMGKDIKKLETQLEVAKAIKEALNLTWKSPRGSDTRLSDLKKQISEITNAYKKFLELRKYMSDETAKNEIGILFPQLKNFDPTLDAVTNRIKDLMKGYKGPKDKVFLDMQNAIDTEISNLNFDALKKTLTDDLKRISEDIKRSETARNFYNDILGLTGDEKLAASLSMEVYGQTGSDFKDRMQKELYQALNSIDKSKIENSTLQQLIADVTTLDWDDLEANLDKVPEEVQNLIKRLRADTEKFNADLAKSLLQSLENAKSYGAKRVEIAQKTAKRLVEIESLGVDDATKENLRKQSAKKEAEEVAKLQYEAFRDSPLYIEMFENLEGASTKMLQNMRNSLIALKGEWRNLSPRELKEMQSKIDEIEKQLATRNPFTSLINSIKAYREMIKGRSQQDVDAAAAMSTQFANEQKRRLETANANYQAVLGRADATQEEKDAAKEELDIQAAMTDTAVDQAEAAQEVASEYRRAAKAILDAANGLEKWAGYVSDSLDGIGEIVSTFASDDVADTFNIVSSGINKTMGGLATTAVNAAGLFAGDLTAIPGLIKGIGETIGGIFGTAQQLRIKKADKDIKEQDRLLEDLEYQYGRLQVTMEKSFGSDYITNYNQQLDALAAKQEAYLKQAEAERSKGKKADEDKIKEHTNNARAAADQITDMQTQLAEYFSGTDLTSAAKDFANAWIEAYKEFGSVTDAMSEKFNDMIQEMVENSVAAQVMQQLLKPIFDEIDRRAREGGELSTDDIAAISKMATEQIPAINDAMTTLMNSLQAAGYDFRQQPGQFTGISRNIANATEESITGLAAGINTQNFYMSMINQNVAAILAVISGGAVPTEGAPSVQFNNELALQHLSGINDKLSTLLNQIDKIIKPMSVPAQYYVSVRQ